MIDLKLLNINYGDSQQDISSKLNYNFSKIIEAGEGAYGRIGNDGPVGSDGVVGITGPYGGQGFKGSQWFIDQNEPSGATAGDLWVNLLNDCEVYKYEDVEGSLTWVSQGFLLAQSGVFEVSLQTGLTSGQPTSAYVQNLFAPQTRTLVLDNLVEGSVKNPQLSKMILGIPGAGASAAYPFLEFSKSPYQGQNSFSDRTPKFYGPRKVDPSSGFSLSYPNYLYIRANDGIDIDANGLKMEYKNLDLSSGAPESTAIEADYYGGVTGSFSNDIVFNVPVPQEQSTTFTCTTGTTSSNNLSVWNVQSANVTSWTTYGFNGNLSFSSTNNIFISSTHQQSSFNVGEFRYTRQKSYTTGENIFRARYKGNNSFSAGSALRNNLDLYVVDSDGNNKFSKKTSAFLPNSGLASGASYARTGLYNCTSPSIVSKDYYTILASMDWYNQTTGSPDFSRWSVGDTFFIDVDLNQSNIPIFGVFLSYYAPNNFGMSSLMQAGETLTFRVVCPSGQGFHGIFVERSSNPTASTSTKNFSDTSQDLNFFGGDSSYTSYANVIELTIFKKGTSTFRVYWKAMGGTLGGITCGCVTTEA